MNTKEITSYKSKLRSLLEETFFNIFLEDINRKSLVDDKKSSTKTIERAKKNRHQYSGI